MSDTIIVPHSGGSTTAEALGTSGADVGVGAASPPSAGQVLTAVSATVATWQAVAAATVNALNSATTVVNVSAATAPTANQVLTATDGTHATWQAIGTAAAANALKSATTTVDVSAATAPAADQILVATDSTHALWKQAHALADVVPATADLTFATAANNVMGSGLKPVFYPLRVPQRKLAVTSLAIYVQTLLAASTLGAAIYSIVYSAASTFAATKVLDLSTTFDGGTTGRKIVDANSAPVTLDFTANQYVVGVCASSAATLKVQGVAGSPQAKTPGTFLYNTALTDCTAASWPGSFTQAAVVGLGTSDPLAVVYLYTAAGKNWF